MMRTWLASAVIVTACGVGLMAGCDKSRDELRPDLDTVHQGGGLQSSDLRKMAAKLGPDLLTIDEVARSPYRTVIVVKNMENKSAGHQGQNMDILVAKLSAALNTASTRDRLLFKEEHATLANIQAQELGTAGNHDPFEDGPRNGMPPPPSPTGSELKPEYALYGSLYSMGSGNTTYYLIKFNLTRIAANQTGPAGAIVWSGSYEVNTLN